MRSYTRMLVILLATVLLCLFVFLCFSGTFHSCADPGHCLLCQTLFELRRHVAVPVISSLFALIVLIDRMLSSEKSAKPCESLAKLCVKLSE